MSTFDMIYIIFILFLRLCWKYNQMEKRKAVEHLKWLSPECTYRLFLIYNQLLLGEDTTDLEVACSSGTTYLLLRACCSSGTTYLLLKV